MKIIFSDHAKQQSIIRKISKSNIIQTVKNPDNIKISFLERKLHQKSFGDKILEVVTIEEDDKTTIVTQYWLKEE